VTVAFVAAVKEKPMKIGSPADIGAAADVSARSVGRPAPATDKPVKGVDAVDKVELSSLGTQIGASASGPGDFDVDKVEALKQAIRDGRFTVNAGAIADRLIADAREMLGPKVN
jgi:negative regulator of flagellin synthesis FlgM